MRGRDERVRDSRALVYCVIPRELAARLHEVLRRHFLNDPGVEVVVERRERDQRMSPERRRGGGSRGELTSPERRLIRSVLGRRVGERRAAQLAVAAPELPRKARPFADRIAFVERLVPSEQHLEDLDTARLVMAIQVGDRSAFAALYTRYFDRVYGYLVVALRDHQAAEDVTQHVFLNALEAIPRYERREQPFRAWLFVIVRRQALAELGRRERLELTDPLDPVAQDRLVPRGDELHALGWLTDHDLSLFIDRLPVAQRQVLVLRYLLDLSYRDIASVLGRSPESVRVLQHRALRFLEDRLIALGRQAVRTPRDRCRGRLRQAIVLRSRRWALAASPPNRL